MKLTGRAMAFVLLLGIALAVVSAVIIAVEKAPNVIVSTVALIVLLVGPWQWLTSDGF